MIDIIANIKIDESKPERITGLIACIRSLAFLKDEAKFIFNLQQPSKEIFDMIDAELQALNKNNLLFTFSGGLFSMSGDNDYGTNYMFLLNKCESPYVLNFIEDHFCMIDQVETMRGILDLMKQHKVDICKASFFQVEQNSSRNLRMLAETPAAKIFLNNQQNFDWYQHYYGNRFYIGVNFITTREFALKFWNRSLGPRPHEYEMPNYSQEWEHICMIPNIPILESIDDDHGEPGTALLNKANPDSRFVKIYNGAKTDLEIKNSPVTEPTAYTTSELELRKRIGNILKDGIHFSGQADGYVIHGAIDGIIALINELRQKQTIFKDSGEAKKAATDLMSAFIRVGYHHCLAELSKFMDENNLMADMKLLDKIAEMSNPENKKQISLEILNAEFEQMKKEMDEPNKNDVV
jgi:hypothetical protein